MKKVLVITYYWPPSGGSGVQRWLKFVKYFPNFNIKPIVYTVDKSNFPIKDSSLISDVRPETTILKKSIWEPNDIFALFGKKNKESSGFLNPNPSIFGKFLQYIRANFFIPDSRKYWIGPSVRYLKSYLKDNQVDLIITTGPPHSLHLIGLKLKKLCGIKWIADFRDPWTEIDYFHKLPLTKKSLHKHKAMEAEVVSKADAVLAVGDTMNSNFKRFNENVFTITNGYDTAVENKAVSLDSKFSITHIGLMNADRNPFIFWGVLAELIKENKQFQKDFELKLIGQVDSGVLSDIKAYDLGENVRFIDYVPHNEIARYQQQSQCLLLVVNNVPSAKAIVTGKIFEYLLADRPILAIGPSDGDLSEIIKTTNSGKIIDFEDKKFLKETILNYYNDFKNNNLKSSTKNRVQFHRKEITKNLVQIIDEVLTNK